MLSAALLSAAMVSYDMAIMVGRNESTPLRTHCYLQAIPVDRENEAVGSRFGSSLQCVSVRREQDLLVKAAWHAANSSSDIAWMMVI